MKWDFVESSAWTMYSSSANITTPFPEEIMSHLSEIVWDECSNDLIRMTSALIDIITMVPQPDTFILKNYRKKKELIAKAVMDSASEWGCQLSKHSVQIVMNYTLFMIPNETTRPRILKYLGLSKYRSPRAIQQIQMN